MITKTNRKYNFHDIYKKITLTTELLFVIIVTTTCIIYLFRVQETPITYSLDAEHNRLEGTGWYGIEQNETITYRWTKSSAEVRLPLRYNSGRTYIAILTGRSVHPEAPQPITFFLNDQLLAEASSSYSMRTYRILLVPPQGDAGLRFSFKTNGFRRENDNRELGILVDEIFLQTIPKLNWTMILGAPLGLLALWFIARWRATAPIALTILITQSLTLSALAIVYQPTALAFEHFVLLTITAAMLSTFIASNNIAQLLLPSIVTLVGYSGIIWSLVFTDDAFISFRYAYNLVHGHGLVFNLGERVEGYTNFLWTILFSAVIGLGGDPVFWAYIFGIAIGFAIVWLTYHTAMQVIGVQWAIVPTLLVAGNQSVLIYTARGSGMETGLFTLLILLGIHTYLASRTNQRIIVAISTGVLFALAALTRPEGVIVFGLTIAHLVISAIGKKGINHTHKEIKQIVNQTLSITLPFLAIFLTHLAWRIWYYGDILPNTFYAKVGSGLQQWLRGLNYTYQFVQTIGTVSFIVALIYPFLLLFNSRLRRKPTSSSIIYIWLLSVVYTIYIIYVGGDHFPGERFFVPIIPLLAILITSSAIFLTQHTTLHRIPHITPILSTLITLSIISNSLYRGTFFEDRVLGNDESVWIWADLGKWLHHNTPPDSSIAAAGIGAIAYYSQREVIDMYGLTDKHIAQLQVESMGTGAAGHEKRDPSYILNIRQPTYIPSLWEDYFGGSAVLQAYYDSIDIRTERGFHLELWKRKKDAENESLPTFSHTNYP